jgi:ABC-2 family transporter protein
LKTVFLLVLNDLKRDWRRPWTVVLYATLPLVMAGLIAAVFGGHGPSSMPVIHVALLDQDNDMIGGLLRSLSGQGEAARQLRLHLVDSRQEGIRMLEERKASAFIILPADMTEDLLQGKTNAIEMYENPAEQVLPKVVWQGASLLVAGLSGAGEVLREPLVTLRELFREESFPEKALVAAAVSESWEKLRGLRGYLFPPLVEFQTVDASAYVIKPANPPSTAAKP